MPPIEPWVDMVSLHPDVLSEDFSEDIFALDVGPLADGDWAWWPRPSPARR